MQKPTTTSAVKGGKSQPQTVAKPVDAIRFLKEDHREVKAWFKAYEKLDVPSEKQVLADKICQALTVHMRIEEELFYPPVRAEIQDDKMLDEAEVEHGSAKQLIVDIRAMKAGQPLFCAKVKVLGEYIEHHVAEEEEEMFPKVRDSEIDLKELGARMAKLKAELMRETLNAAA